MWFFIDACYCNILVIITLVSIIERCLHWTANMQKHSRYYMSSQLFNCCEHYSCDSSFTHCFWWLSLRDVFTGLQMQKLNTHSRYSMNSQIFNCCEHYSCDTSQLLSIICNTDRKPSPHDKLQETNKNDFQQDLTCSTFCYRGVSTKEGRLSAGKVYKLVDFGLCTKSLCATIILYFQRMLFWN